MALAPAQATINGLFKRLHQHGQRCCRPGIIAPLSSRLVTNSAQDTSGNKDLIPDTHPRRILAREFPNHFRDGKFVSRMSYVEFIDEALNKAKELGLEKNLDLYKELLRIFPPGQFWPTNSLEFGLFHAPQQLAVTRLFHQMNRNGLKTDKEFEKLVVNAFSKKSDVWLLVTRYNYWSMKFRNADENPLPEELPNEPHQLAKLAMMRMLPDHKSIITVTNTSKVTGSTDKTWVVSSQSPTQQAIIDRLDAKSTLYIEDGGLIFVGSRFLSYFVLKYYVDDKTAESKKERPPDYNFNTLKMSFFGMPIKDKLTSLEDKHYADGSYILAVCATGTSSQDSLLSWLKLLQQRNPQLSKLNVVFKMSRPSPEIIEYNIQDESGPRDSEHQEEVTR